MQAVAEELKSILKNADNLRQIGDRAASVRPAPGKWSRKEILGHLVDSATNNHQRFVRASLDGSGLTFPGYLQDDWVRMQGYASAPWEQLVDLWAAYNQHLIRVISALPNFAGTI